MKEQVNRKLQVNRYYDTPRTTEYPYECKVSAQALGSSKARGISNEGTILSNYL